MPRKQKYCKYNETLAKCRERDDFVTYTDYQGRTYCDYCKKTAARQYYREVHKVPLEAQKIRTRSLQKAKDNSSKATE